jgi:kynurenine formamidase
MKLFDLSHTIEHGMVTYRGLPAPVIGAHLSHETSRAIYAGEAEFHIGRIEMVANTGTYLDSPFHRFENGKDLSELPLASLANVEGLKVSAEQASGRALGPELFDGLSLRGRAVLIHTGWSARWRTEEYFDGHPYLTREAAQLLASAGATLVGIDSYNVDDTADLSRPAHTILLGAEIPVVEHLRGLEALPAEGFRFFAVSVKVRRFGTFPVRAFAVVDEED